MTKPGYTKSECRACYEEFDLHVPAAGYSVCKCGDCSGDKNGLCAEHLTVHQRAVAANSRRPWEFLPLEESN